MTENVSDFWKEQAKLLRGYKRPSKASQELPEQESQEIVKEEQPGSSESVSPYSEEALAAPLEEGEVRIDSEPIAGQLYTFRPILPSMEETYQARALVKVGDSWLFEKVATGERVRKRLGIEWLVPGEGLGRCHEEIPGFFWCTVCQKYHPEGPPVEYAYKRMREARKRIMESYEQGQEETV